MNNYQAYADINCIVVYIVVGLVAFIIFPIFINVGTIYIKEHKKVYFDIRLFSLISVLSGYIQREKNKLFIHLSKRKAIMVDLLNFTTVQKGVKPFFDYHFISQYSRIEIGSKNNLMIPLTAGFLTNFLLNISRWLLINRKPYLKVQHNVYVYDGEEVFNLFLKSTIVFNLLMILISLIKIGIGKLYGK